MQTKHPLDNPIWTALTTRQAHFAEICNQARRFPPEVTTLGAFPAPSQEGFDALAALQTTEGATGLFLEGAASLPAGWTIVDQAPLLQMVREDRQKQAPAITSGGVPGWPPERSPEWPAECTVLTEQDVPEMVVLAKLTKPGPFGRRTRELGTYIGIRREGKLVAMAGERLRVPGYSEISAVCTHPEYTGQGLAALLMNVLIGEILSRGETPFLHVRSTNQRAIELYRRLGFADRLLYHYVSVCKPAAQSRSAS
jgi:ribosomal protein S18 acetylase RimI-like enzyme